MTRRTSPALLLLGSVGMCVGGPALAVPTTRLTPLIDVEQFTQQQIQGVGDSVTYTELTVGLTGQVTTHRLIASVNYRFDQRIKEAGNLQNSRSQDGVARARLLLVDDLLSLDGGGLVTHTRVDPGGAAPQVDTGGAKNLTQVYNVYVSPELTHTIGEVGIEADYRYSYTRNQDSQPAPFAGGTRLEQFSSSMDHQVGFVVGMKRSSLPFDWTFRNNYQYETTTDLDRHFITASSTGEVILPVTRTIAVVSSAGYEVTKTSQLSALMVGGFPVVTSNGSVAIDPNSPRMLTYDMEGVVGNGGIIWVPSHHTRLEVRAGYRYGGFTVTGAFDYAPEGRSKMHLVVFDQIQTFGQGLTDGLSSASPSSSFSPTQGLSSSPTQNCISGAAGSCVGNTLGSAAPSPYRSRGANLTYSREMHRTTVGLTIGYQRKSYIDQPGVAGSMAGVVDKSWVVQANLTRQLTQISGVNFALSGNLFNNGTPGVADVKAVSFNGGYFRNLGRRLRAQATFGVDASKTVGASSDISARGQIGFGYQF